MESGMGGWVDTIVSFVPPGSLVYLALLDFVSPSTTCLGGHLGGHCMASFPPWHAGGSEASVGLDHRR